MENSKAAKASTKRFYLWPVPGWFEAKVGTPPLNKRPLLVIKDAPRPLRLSGVSLVAELTKGFVEG
jgi:hypothetical protein